MLFFYWCAFLVLAVLIHFVFPSKDDLVPTDQNDFTTTIQKEGIFLGTSIFTEKSVKVIIKNLMNNEQILLMTRCNSGSAAGVLAVTNRRIIFGSVILWKSTIKDFDIKKITSVTYSSELANKIKIQSSADVLMITAIEKNAGQLIVNKIKELQMQGDSGSEQVSSGQNDLNDLEKLADLKEKGIITEEEFSLKKKQILGL